jgi:phenylpropionate dioxygenase-like ring-hydroxylating dioxygenase large terminal subunit
MSMLQFWHPVLHGRDLPRDRAVGVRLAGQSLALFRPGPGQVAAIGDVCPHRRMRLCLGKVNGGRLTCVYHGWTFDGDGQGESPGTPKLHACADSYDCREAHGVVWVKARGPDVPLPVIDHAGFVPVGAVFHRIKAPLQLVMDNFSEVEHTIAMHPTFGFDPARSHEAVVTFEATDDAVTVHNVGPAKPIQPLARLLLLFRRRYFFHSDYTFFFDPPRAVIEHRWTDPVGGGEAMAKYRLHHFFVPEDQQTTRLVTFGAARSRWPLPGGGVPLMGWYLRRAIAATIDEDVWLLENLADQTPDLDGMKLSRFDRVLGLTRERLRRIYYGETEAMTGTSPEGEGCSIEA